MNIARTRPTDAVRALLAANDLPTDDLDDPNVVLFAATEGESLRGVVGLQWLEGGALLRSLAVDASQRDRGLGSRLCDLAVSEAGRSELWLLTTSARDYFTKRGFETVQRDQVPAAVRATAQFSTLCPASASVMRKTS